MKKHETKTDKDVIKDRLIGLIKMYVEAIGDRGARQQIEWTIKDYLKQLDKA